MFFYCPIVLIIEFITSYLLNSGAISIIKRRVLRAFILSILTNICSWAAFYIVAKIGDWNLVLIFFASSGDIIGDTLVAARWPKWVWRLLDPPRKRREKFPVTTA